MGLLEGSDNQSNHGGNKDRSGDKSGQQHFIYGIRIVWQWQRCNSEVINTKCINFEKRMKDGAE